MITCHYSLVTALGTLSSTSRQGPEQPGYVEFGTLVTSVPAVVVIDGFPALELLDEDKVPIQARVTSLEMMANGRGLSMRVAECGPIIAICC